MDLPVTFNSGERCSRIAIYILHTSVGFQLGFAVRLRRRRESTQPAESDQQTKDNVRKEEG